MDKELQRIIIAKNKLEMKSDSTYAIYALLFLRMMKSSQFKPWIVDCLDSCNYIVKRLEDDFSPAVVLVKKERVTKKISEDRKIESTYFYFQRRGVIQGIE